MQANIQNEEPINVTVINSGVIPKILIIPGAERLQIYRAQLLRKVQDQFLLL